MHPIVIRFGRLGDMLLLAPLLNRLHRNYGTPCALLGTGPWTVPMYTAHPDVAKILQVDARHRPLVFSPQRWRMLQYLRANPDAPVHVCESEPRTLDKICRMLALARVDRERCIFLADTPAVSEQHWIDRLLDACGKPPAACAKSWHAPAISEAHAPQLVSNDEDRRDLDAWLRARGWHGEAVWLLQPANKRSMRWNGPRDAVDDAKAWPTCNWVTVLHALNSTHPGARFILCGAPHEAPLLEAIAARAQLGNLDVAARDLPLRRLMALAGMARGMLSVDTGPAHVAAAMGCPLVVLFGAESPSVWCPRSPTGSAVIALGGPPARSRVAEIAPEEVIAALCQLPPREPKLPRVA